MKNEGKMIQTKIPGVSLRFASENDVEQILAFIKALAEYEKMSLDVEATEESIKETLFGKRAFAEVIFAELDGRAVGFALFFHNYSTFVSKPGLYLEDIFVYPAYRGRGIGKVMMAYLAHLTLERHCGRFEWSCLKWNTQSLDFYRALGANTMDDWVTLRISGENLHTLVTSFKKHRD